MAKAHTKGSIHALGIILGKELYALRTHLVREVLAHPQLTRVPKAPLYVRGVLNLRGNILPVVDLLARLGIRNETPSSYPWVVVVDIDGETLGVGAEKVTKLLRIHEDELMPPPALLASISHENIEAVAPHERGFVIFLDLDRVLGDEDGENSARATP